jgi:hypothetical protein
MTALSDTHFPVFFNLLWIVCVLDIVRRVPRVVCVCVRVCAGVRYAMEQWCCCVMWTSSPPILPEKTRTRNVTNSFDVSLVVYCCEAVRYNVEEGGRYSEAAP